MTVSELTAQIKEVLEGRFPVVWVSGEVSGLSRPSSGHLYLTLKDAGAQVRAVIWRSVAARVPFELVDGLEVIVCGALNVYEPRGSYQLVVEHVQPKGIGPRELALRQLREKLAKEGLFDPARKKPLPRFPRRIALVTSPSGAAVRDLIQIITRRWPAVELWVLPVRVQGEGAAGEIAAGVALANRLPGIDVMIVGRGGGSLEDLWAFNEEMVARAIAASQVPVISAVGHEIDVTIADLVADRRALTPSEAAELAVPDVKEVSAGLLQLGRRMGGGLAARCRHARAELEGLAHRPVFRRPLERVMDLGRVCDDLGEQAMRAISRRLQSAEQEVARLAQGLESLSPLKVLARGYSLTLRADGRTIVRDAAAIGVGEEIVTRLASGRLVSRVERAENG